MTLKERVQGFVYFERYQAGNLWYRTEDLFLFPVPIEDIGNATFYAKDKAMLFMRYIRKHMDLCAKAKEAFE